MIILSIIIPKAVSPNNKPDNLNSIGVEVFCFSKGRYGYLFYNEIFDMDIRLILWRYLFLFYV